MKLDCILTACNTNQLYMDFIPIFIRAWKKLYPDVDVKIILIAHDIPLELGLYSQYITLFPPIEGIHDAYISQIIRILYPSLLSYTGAILTTDIDMLPMNSSYYSKPLELLTSDKFVHYRNGPMYWQDMYQYAICYNAATSQIWKDINGIHTMDDLTTFIQKNYNSTYNGNTDQNEWYSDQTVLYKMLQNWNKKDSQIILLKDEETGFRRLDRSEHIDMETIIPFVQNEQYTDYHCLRPYKEYKSINETIIDNLPSKHPCYRIKKLT
jgi:hypothetical protein